MSNIRFFSVVLGLLAGSAIQANAAVLLNPDYQDVDSFGDGVQGIWLAPGQGVSGTFDIKLGENDTWTVPSYFSGLGGVTFSDKAGFQPGVSAPLRSAQAFFYVGGLDSGEIVDIDLASGDFLTAGGGAQKFFLLGGEIQIDLLVALNTKGELEYSILNESPAGHYFAVKAAQLQATVPDGGLTLALLGTAMTGLALFRNKLA